MPPEYMGGLDKGGRPIPARTARVATRARRALAHQGVGGERRNGRRARLLGRLPDRFAWPAGEGQRVASEGDRAGLDVRLLVDPRSRSPTACSPRRRPTSPTRPFSRRRCPTCASSGASWRVTGRRARPARQRLCRDGAALVRTRGRRPARRQGARRAHRLPTAVPRADAAHVQAAVQRALSGGCGDGGA
jgi:hypothetical protein